MTSPDPAPRRRRASKASESPLGGRPPPTSPPSSKPRNRAKPPGQPDQKANGAETRGSSSNPSSRPPASAKKRDRSHVWSRVAAEREIIATAKLRRTQPRAQRVTAPLEGYGPYRPSTVNPAKPGMAGGQPLQAGVVTASPSSPSKPTGPSLGRPSLGRPSLGLPRRVALPPISRAWTRLGALLGAALVIVLAVLVLAQPGGAPGIRGIGAGSSPGGSSAASLFNGTFDEFAIGSRLPEPWQVTDPASAAIVALPTSADRSVRLRSDASGAATRACRPIIDALPGAPLRVQVDVLVESLPETSPSPLLSLQRAGQIVAGIALGPSGAVADVNAQTDGAVPSGGTFEPGGSASSGGALLTGRWYQLSMVLDRASGTYSWQAQRADAVQIASVGPEPLPEGAGQGIDAVCVGSPAGARSGAILVNDLLVRE
jgi:hypothetical protein